MSKQIKLRRAGGSLSATLPKDMLDRLNLKEGDTLTVVATPEGILLTPYDPDFAEAMEHYEQVARKYRNAFRELSR